MIADATLADAYWIGASVFLLGMSKGGFPVGSIALPLLVLAWPEKQESARSAVGFMLPMLCVMDFVAILFYRRRIQWARLLPLVPGTLLGVAVGSVLFVSAESSLLAVSDRVLKLCIGMLGILFVLNFVAREWMMRRREGHARPGLAESSAFGLGAGLTSTLAHAAGPLISMYLLPQRLPKLQFAGTLVAYFWALNLVKMVPFLLMGRIEQTNLLLGAKLLPLVPLGVLAGYALVRVMRQRHYVAFIYVVLLVTSLTLVARALAS